jgi:hypothetical protein
MGFTLSISPDGAYSIAYQLSGWVFGGVANDPLQQLSRASGADRIGPYNEIVFQFAEGGTPKQAGIRLYLQKPVVLFTVRFLRAGNNHRAFPHLSSHPAGLYRLTNSGWEQHFNELETTGPLVEFDAEGHTFILSPAANFMVAATSASRI